MKTKKILFLFLILIQACKPGGRKEIYNHQIDSSNMITIEQSDLIYNKVKAFPGGTQISIALIQNDSTRFYGVKRQNDTLISLDNRTRVFEIGSITKLFTSALLADLVVEGKVKLDNKINDKLSFELNNGISLSFKQLANHTSGLPRRPRDIIFSLIKNPLDPYSNYTTENLEKYLSEKLKLIQDPGQEYAYSNLGVGILGYTICEIENNEYQRLLEEKIFAKFGMTHSSSIRADVQDFLVPGLGPYGNEISNWDMGSLEAAGNILSTAVDLSKFAIAQFDTSNRVLKLCREKTFRVNEHLDIGLAWHIRTDDSGNTCHWHNGGTGGYRSCLVVDTESRIAVVVLSNVSIGHRKNDEIDDLSFELIKTLRMERSPA